MSGLGSRPQDDAEWARQVEKRLRALEYPTAIRMGEWTVHVGQFGDLVADNTTTNRRYTLASGDRSNRAGIADD
ncbi:hypothetical protein SEA_SOOS_55 [Gordonia phage Soos]|nr:hypothetical protein SEA_SOOS_55 [Gordonia phage Soos]